MIVMMTRLRSFLPILLISALAAGLAIPGLQARSIWYDEAITLLDVAGNARPRWPEGVVLAAEAQERFSGNPAPAQIVTDLEETDVHPPLYYLALAGWQYVVGSSLEGARALSLLFAIVSALVFYFLLRACGIRHAFLATVVMVAASGFNYISTEARNYSLALLLVGISALAAWKAQSGTRHSLMWSITMGASCGLAFHTNYLTLFSSAAILLWHAISFIRRRAWREAAGPVIAAGVGGLCAEVTLRQLHARPDQFSGTVPFSAEVIDLLRANLGLFWTGIGELPRTIAWASIACLLLATAWALRRQHAPHIFLFALAGAAPLAGAIVLDFVFEKHIAGIPYYSLFAFPFIIGLMATGMDAMRPARVAAIALIACQLSVINPGVEDPGGWPAGKFRSLADVIAVDAGPDTLVILGNGTGHKDQASALYELRPNTQILFLMPESDLENILEVASRYKKIWVIIAWLGEPGPQESALLDALWASGLQADVVRHPAGVLFTAQDTGEAAPGWALLSK